MDAHERAALARAIDDVLRRPGEVFTEEWRGYRPRHSGFLMNVMWLQDPRDDAPNEAHQLDDALSQAWDELCDDPAFKSWLAVPAHHELTETPNILSVEEREDERLRVTQKGNLYAYVPIARVRQADARVAFFKGVIIRVLSRRASDAGLPPPPL